jgi:ribosomal-protein-alanine N-acetyltransferase
MSSVTASIVRHRRIITLRLILRDLVEEDWPDVLAYQCDPRYLYYPWEGRTEADLRELVGMFLEQHTEAPRRKFQLAITLPDQPGLIENCGIRRKPDNDREVDIRYEVSPEYWGRGFATEAAQTIVDFGFQELDLHRISSWSVADNTASAHVLEKLGLVQEGRLRENEYFKGRWWDTLLHGMYPTDWACPGSQNGE